MSHKPPPHRKWLHRLPKDLQQALRDLPKALQDAVHVAVAACKPRNAPRLYAHDWLEELYHEAIVGAWEAQQRYDPSEGCSLYRWGLWVIGQRLQAFCDGVWAVAKHECAYPCDEETGEEVEFPDERASEEMEAGLLESAVWDVLHQLGGLDERIGLWHLFDELSEREIANWILLVVLSTIPTLVTHAQGVDPCRDCIVLQNIYNADMYHCSTDVVNAVNRDCFETMIFETTRWYDRLKIVLNYTPEREKGFSANRMRRWAIVC